MRILGHPVHMVLIHFPSALFPMDIACSLLAFYTGDLAFAHASYFAMAGGVALGTLAIITGAIDLIGVVENKPLAVKKALIHGGINTAVICGYSVLAYRAYRDFPDLVPDTVTFLIIKGLLLTLMIAGNFLGGSLILKDGVAVHDKAGKT